MRMPSFLNNINISTKAKIAMEVGTKFANKAIDPELSAHDLAGCLKLCIKRNERKWFIRRIHGIYNRRRMDEERIKLDL